MTPEIALVLGLFVVAIVALWLERVSPDAVAMALVAALVASGTLSAAEAFRGLASETIVVLACVMILSRRLSDTGIIARLTRRLVGRAGGDKGRGATVQLMGLSALLSTVFSNTSTTAVLLPAATEAARRIKVPVGRLLMPMAFGSMMGGSATLIGTSTNLAASGAVSRMGLAPFTLFEFIVPGLIVTAGGMAVIGLFGRWLVAERGTATPADKDEIGFFAVVTLPEGSEAADVPLGKVLQSSEGIAALSVGRSSGRVSADPRRKLLQGDSIVVRAGHAALAKLSQDPRLALDGRLGDDVPGPVAFAPAVVLPGSRWHGMTLARMRRALGRHTGVVGLHRAGLDEALRIDRMRLRVGDVLLLEGTDADLRKRKEEPDLYLPATPDPALPTAREGWYTLAGLAAALTVGATGLLPLSVALLTTVLALVFAGRFTMQDAYAMISWRILVLIGGMSSFGIAMLSSGSAAWLAERLLVVAEPFGITGALVGLSLLTVLLTQPLSNAAAALTVLPIAVAMAGGLGVDPRPVAIVVTLSASLSFIAPLEPALMLVYGPGGYRLRDFMIAGLPLTAFSVALVVLVVPILWPL